MKNPLKGLALITASTVFSLPVMAHPGHDHSHWSSPALHSLAAAAGIAIIAACAFAVHKRRKRAALQRQEEK